MESGVACFTVFLPKRLPGSRAASDQQGADVGACGHSGWLMVLRDSPHSLPFHPHPRSHKNMRVYQDMNSFQLAFKGNVKGKTIVVQYIRRPMYKTQADLLTVANKHHILGKETADVSTLLVKLFFNDSERSFSCSQVLHLFIYTVIL